MKTAYFLGIPAFALLSAAGLNIDSCNKPKSNSATDCNTSSWTNYVYIEDIPGDKNFYTLPEKIFIGGGHAELEQRFTNYYRYWTGIELAIPCDKKIAAENTRLEWYCKSNLSIGMYESDMGASLSGEKDTASINCITVNRPPYFLFRYGDIKLNNVPELVNDPSEWAVYAIDISEKGMSFSKNGVVKKSIAGKKTLGNLQKIYLHFKGGGRIDWVKLYEHNKLIMEDNFDKPGQSSIHWIK